MTKRWSSKFLPLAVFAGVLIAWGATLWLLHDDPARGTFGDMFGSINALFSGLAFAGVIYAILLQREELALQRRELELTRRELEGQKEQLKAQNATLRNQRFENTFFQLLALQNQITTSIEHVGRGNRSLRGRDCFESFCGRFRQNWEKNVREHAGQTDIACINKAYLDFYKSHQSDVGHYFRSLYNIVKLVDQSDIDDKHLYTNLIRAQLSSFELVLLFYNSLSDLGREKFKPLIEKYALLKTVPRDQLLNSAHVGFYAFTAYGGAA